MADYIGPCLITYSGTVEWSGTASLKVGKAATLTLQNVGSQTAIFLETEEIETRTGLLRPRWKEQKWGTSSYNYKGPKSVRIPAGTTKTWYGKSHVEKRVGADHWHMNRWIITYVPPTTNEPYGPPRAPSEYPPDATTDPPPVGDDMNDSVTQNGLGNDGLETGLGDGLGPVGGPGLDTDPVATASKGNRGMAILLLLVAVLALYAGWKGKSMLLGKALGVVK